MTWGDSNGKKNPETLSPDHITTDVGPRLTPLGRYQVSFTKLLPPANEVWGKVICLQVCVCPQGWVCLLLGGVWSAGSGSGGCLVKTPPPTTATAPGGTHPTGMHSC